MRVAVFSDVHAHADALGAVLRAAVDADVDELWSLGDMVGTGPDPVRVVATIRAYCSVALVGNHDYAATGAVDPGRFGAPGSALFESIKLAASALADSGDLEWLRTRKPAARRAGLQCWHASPRNPVWEFVGTANAAACLERQRAPLGLVGHTHAPAAWQAQPDGGVRRMRVDPDRPLDLSESKWLLNPGAVGAPTPSAGDRWPAMERHARAGAWWLELDLDDHVATWRRAPFDAAPACERARAAGLAVGKRGLVEADGWWDRSPAEAYSRVSTTGGRPCPTNTARGV